MLLCWITERILDNKRFTEKEEISWISEAKKELPLEQEIALEEEQFIMIEECNEISTTLPSIVTYQVEKLRIRTELEVEGVELPIVEELLMPQIREESVSEDRIITVDLITQQLSHSDPLLHLIEEMEFVIPVIASVKTTKKEDRTNVDKGEEETESTDSNVEVVAVQAKNKTYVDEEQSVKEDFNIRAQWDISTEPDVSQSEFAEQSLDVVLKDIKSSESSLEVKDDESKPCPEVPGATEDDVKKREDVPVRNVTTELPGNGEVILPPVTAESLKVLIHTLVVEAENQEFVHGLKPVVYTDAKSRMLVQEEVMESTESQVKDGATATDAEVVAKITDEVTAMHAGDELMKRDETADERWMLCPGSGEYRKVLVTGLSDSECIQVEMEEEIVDETSVIGKNAEALQFEETNEVTRKTDAAAAPRQGGVLHAVETVEEPLGEEQEAVLLKPDSMGTTPLTETENVVQVVFIKVSSVQLKDDGKNAAETECTLLLPVIQTTEVTAETTLQDDKPVTAAGEDAEHTGELTAVCHDNLEAESANEVIRFQYVSTVYMLTSEETGSKHVQKDTKGELPTVPEGTNIVLRRPVQIDDHDVLEVQLEMVETALTDTASTEGLEDEDVGLLHSQESDLGQAESRHAEVSDWSKSKMSSSEDISKTDTSVNKEYFTAEMINIAVESVDIEQCIETISDAEMPTEFKLMLSINKNTLTGPVTDTSDKYVEVAPSEVEYDMTVVGVDDDTKCVWLHVENENANETEAELMLPVSEDYIKPGVCAEEVIVQKLHAEMVPDIVETQTTLPQGAERMAVETESLMQHEVETEQEVENMTDEREIMTTAGQEVGHFESVFTGELSGTVSTAEQQYRIQGDKTKKQDRDETEPSTWFRAQQGTAEMSRPVETVPDTLDEQQVETSVSQLEVKDTANESEVQMVYQKTEQDKVRPVTVDTQEAAIIMPQVIDGSVSIDTENEEDDKVVQTLRPVVCEGGDPTEQELVVRIINESSLLTAANEVAAFAIDEQQEITKTVHIVSPEIHDIETEITSVSTEARTRMMLSDDEELCEIEAADDSTVTVYLCTERLAHETETPCIAFPTSSVIDRTLVCDDRSQEILGDDAHQFHEPAQAHVRSNSVTEEKMPLMMDVNCTVIEDVQTESNMPYNNSVIVYSGDTCAQVNTIPESFDDKFFIDSAHITEVRTSEEDECTLSASEEHLSDCLTIVFPEHSDISLLPDQPRSGTTEVVACMEESSLFHTVTLDDYELHCDDNIEQMLLQSQCSAVESTAVEMTLSVDVDTLLTLPGKPQLSKTIHSEEKEAKNATIYDKTAPLAAYSDDINLSKTGVEDEQVQRIGSVGGLVDQIAAGGNTETDEAEEDILRLSTQQLSLYDGTLVQIVREVESCTDTVSIMQEVNVPVCLKDEQTQQLKASVVTRTVSHHMEVHDASHIETQGDGNEREINKEDTSGKADTVTEVDDHESETTKVHEAMETKPTVCTMTTDDNAPKSMANGDRLLQSDGKVKPLAEFPWSIFPASVSLLGDDSTATAVSLSADISKEDNVRQDVATSDKVSDDKPVESSAASSSSVVTRRVQRLSADGSIVERVKSEAVPVSFGPSSLRPYFLSGDLPSPPDFSPQSDDQQTSVSSVKVYTDTVEAQPCIERRIEEVKEMNSDGEIVMRRVVRVRKRRTIIKHIVIEGPEFEEEEILEENSEAGELLKASAVECVMDLAVEQLSTEDDGTIRDENSNTQMETGFSASVDKKSAEVGPGSADDARSSGLRSPRLSLEFLDADVASQTSLHGPNSTSDISSCVGDGAAMDVMESASSCGDFATGIVLVTAMSAVITASSYF